MLRPTSRTLLALAIVVSSRQGDAQATAVPIADLRPNERLSVEHTWDGSHRYETMIYVRSVGDSLWVRRGRDEDAFPIVLRDVRNAAVARGTHRSSGAMFITGVAGAISGMFAGWASCQVATCDGGLDGQAMNSRISLGFLAGGILGVVIGSSPRDVWVPVALPSRR